MKLKQVQLIEKIIKRNAGVVYLKGKPGIGKTEIPCQIAARNGWAVEIKKVGDVDSSEIGGIPREGLLGDVRVMEYLVPKWAVEANKRPTLVILDELNRAPLQNRNACLKMLNERLLGESGFKFNDNVYFVATGNLGEADGTEVEILESAMNNRLVHVEVREDAEAWLDYMEKKGGNVYVREFIAANPTHLYKWKEEAEAYASPRSWDRLSAFLNFEPDLTSVKEVSEEIASGYVGESAIDFVRFLGAMQAISLDAVLRSGAKKQDEIRALPRAYRSKLIADLGTLDVKRLTPAQMNNVIAFLKVCDEDEYFAYIQSVMKVEAFNVISGKVHENVSMLRDSFDGVVDLIKRAMAHGKKGGI